MALPRAGSWKSWMRTSSGLPLGPPFLPRVLEIADQFLLFRVYRHNRLPTLLQPAHLLADVGELGIAVRVAFPFPSVAIGFEALTCFAQQPRHGTGTDRMVLPSQFCRQSSCTLTGPAQRCLRITTSNGFQHLVQGDPQFQVRIYQMRTSAAWPAQARTDRLRVALLGFQFPNAGRDRR